jgi:acyl-CoA synthetase (AMP-forming)/AMP-acid ligase II
VSAAAVVDDLLRRGGERRVAVVTESETLSFAALRERVFSAERAFLDVGYEPGDRVAISDTSTLDLLASLLGGVRAGLLVGVLSQSLGHAARSLRLRDLRPGGAPSSCTGGVALWTSGSTGLPRCVVFEPAALVWNATQNALALGLEKTDRALVHLDGAYCYALVHQIFSHLVVGGSVALPPQPSWLPEIGLNSERHHATTVALMPSMLEAILRSDDICRSLGRLRVITVGGGPSSEPLLRRAREKLRSILFVTYGLTEAGPRVCTRRADRTSAEGVVGTPLPGIEVALDEEGELLVKTPSGRFGALIDGRLVRLSPWIRTGDRADIMSDGSVRILARKTPVIDRGGLKIAPAEIEAVLRSHDGVFDARVTAMPHRRLGQVPRALVVPGTPPPSVAELASYCLERLGRAWVPASIELVPSLPPRGAATKEVVHGPA